MDRVVSSPFLVRQILECGSAPKLIFGLILQHGGMEMHGPDTMSVYRNSEVDKTMACCARVSKVWHYEACGVLWSIQYGLSDMMQLLELGIQGTVLESQHAVSRFSHYATFVKFLFCSDVDFKDCTTTVKAQALVAGLSSFPTIKVLDLSRTQFLDRSVVNAASWLMGSSLQRLFLPLSAPEFGSLMMAGAISRFATQELIKFSMKGDTTSEDDRQVFVDFIRASTSLKEITVHISWLNYEGIQMLGKLHNLSSLELVEQRAIPLLSDPLSRQETLDRFLVSDDSLFASLSYLRLECYNYVARSLLEVVFAHAQLREALISTPLKLPPRALNMPYMLPFTLLSKNILNLVTIRVSMGTGDQMGRGRQRISADELIPRLEKHSIECLSSCKALEILEIAHTRVPKLSDEDILSLAQSWPCLSTLRFNGVSLFQWQDTPQTTVTILEHLPQLCPKLTSVGLVFAATSPELRHAQNRSPVSLQCVIFAMSFISDAPENTRENSIMRIAAYLSAVLPSSCHVIHERIDVIDTISHPGISEDEWDDIVDVHEQSNEEIKRYLRFFEPG